MITIAWYNIVAIIVAILAVVFVYFTPKDSGGPAGGLAGCFYILILIIVFGLFFTIWGGIFWW